MDYFVDIRRHFIFAPHYTMFLKQNSHKSPDGVEIKH
jgi:hypothetical protein